MKRIHAALSILLIALVTGAWVIKDTASSVDIYSGSNSTPTISAATTGAVTLGPTSSTVTHTFNGQLRFTNQFVYVRQQTGNSVGTVVSTHTDLGTLDSLFVGVTVPRAGNYRIKFAGQAAGTTANNNGIQQALGLRKTASAGSYAGSAALGPSETCQVGNSPSGTYRPVCQVVVEYIGALAANDKIYFSVISFDNPVATGVFGGGSISQIYTSIEELTASTIQ